MGQALLAKSMAGLYYCCQFWCVHVQFTNFMGGVVTVLWLTAVILRDIPPPFVAKLSSGWQSNLVKLN